MIAPDFRATEQIELMKEAKRFISFNYGKSAHLSTLFWQATTCLKAWKTISRQCSKHTTSSRRLSASKLMQLN
jgi:hypothetical protein